MGFSPAMSVFEVHRPSNLPDVAGEIAVDAHPRLDWVGMKEIEIPVWLEGAEGRFRQAARADAQVSLDQGNSRGIHMSRLYLIVQEGLASAPLSFALLGEMAGQFLGTHEGLSTSARLEVRLPWPLKRKALKSGFEAWRTYPVAMSVERHGAEESFFLETTVTYSSTCPASAALARQLIQKNFISRFEGAGMVPAEDVAKWLGTTEGVNATPHAQRSEARLKVRLAKGAAFGAEELIDLVEDALQTAVQGAVKREDEQEFALRNGQNLMFCEDAARRVKSVLDLQPAILGYDCEFIHVESLHPHNAVSRIRK